jgi:energy-coupling factor transport system ATP-binding protein
MISADGLCFRYPEQASNTPDILQEITFHIQKGEYIAIVGGNGSGKSTLVKLIDGLLFPTSGLLTVNGISVTGAANLAELRKQIGLIFQFPEDQIVASTVEEDVAFGLENYGVPTVEMRARVRKILEGFDLWDLRGRTTTMLSGGQTQRLALAGVLAIGPDCLIFDEATSMLDPAARKNLMGVMKGLNTEGKTILHVTHSMEEAYQADRVFVLKHGQLVFDGTPFDLFNQHNISSWNLEYPEIIRYCQIFKQLGLRLPENPRSTHELVPYLAEQLRPVRVKKAVSKRKATEPVIEVSGLAYTYLAGTLKAVPALYQVDVEIPGETGYGFVGKTGSGKSTVLQHLNGLFNPQQGMVRIGNHDLTKPYQLADVVRTAGLVMQNPESHFFEFYVGDEIAFGPRNIGYEGRLVDRVSWAMGLVGLDFVEFRDKPVHTLSGGQKRKVALASVLAMKPEILVLDEPTAGLDPIARQEILNKFTGLVDTGLTLVVSSHNLVDIVTLSANMTIMDAGRSTASGRTKDVLWDKNMLLNHGIEPLPISRLGHELGKVMEVEFNPIGEISDLLAQVEGAGHD